ncbi:hypothetical protein HF313_21615 [Massilia atriviolacea]|nr:hypothetical protein [Massilia atriviolacea]
MMAPETKLALRALFKKIALVCVLLALVTCLCIYFIENHHIQMLGKR